MPPCTSLHSEESPSTTGGNAERSKRLRTHLKVCLIQKIPQCLSEHRCTGSRPPGAGPAGSRSARRSSPSTWSACRWLISDTFRISATAPTRTASATFPSCKWATACFCRAPRASRTSSWRARRRPSPRESTWTRPKVRRAPTGVWAASSTHPRRRRNAAPCRFWTQTMERWRRRNGTKENIAKRLPQRAATNRTRTVASHSASTWVLQSWRMFSRWWSNCTNRQFRKLEKEKKKNKTQKNPIQPELCRDIIYTLRTKPKISEFLLWLKVFNCR